MGKRTFNGRGQQGAAFPTPPSPLLTTLITSSPHLAPSLSTNPIPTLLNFNNTLHMARTKVCLCLSSSSSPTSLNAINSSSSLHSKPPASPPEVRSFPSLTLTHLTFHHLISSSPYPSTGKAPRKQLATKAARKTATAVRAPPPPR